MDTPRSSRARPLGFLVIVGLVALVLVLDMRRRAAEDQLAKLSVQLNQSGNEEQNRAAAQAIVERVRALIDIPTDIEPTVATIVDVEQLREKNAFYAKAENGDHLIVTNERAILYRPTENKIIDVVPVQIQAPAAANPAPGADTNVKATPPAAPAAAVEGEANASADGIED